MSQHKYAFKLDGKTLGIRDVDQLLRMIETGKLTSCDKVFLIASKRWESISALPEVAAARLAIPAESATQDLTSLINRELATLRPTRSFAASDLSDVSFDNGRTIRPSHITEQVRARRTETLVANRVPVESRANTRAAFLTAILVLLLGMAVGFLGAFEITESVVPSGDTVILQAQQGNPKAPSRD